MIEKYLQIIWRKRLVLRNLSEKALGSEDNERRSLLGITFSFGETFNEGH